MVWVQLQFNMVWTSNPTQISGALDLQRHTITDILYTQHLRPKSSSPPHFAMQDDIWGFLVTFALGVPNRYGSTLWCRARLKKALGLQWHIPATRGFQLNDTDDET
jgi:hypothetical protein